MYKTNMLLDLAGLTFPVVILIEDHDVQNIEKIVNGEIGTWLNERQIEEAKKQLWRMKKLEGDEK